MFRCQLCHHNSKSGEPSTELVLETRSRVYPSRTYRVRGDHKDRIDPGGVGTELVRTIRVCASCSSRSLGQEPT